MSAGSPPRNPIVGVLVLGTIFTFTLGLLGALVGGLYVRFFMPRASNGWDGIADALGGLMLGGLIGLVLALVLLFLVLARRGLRAIALATAVLWLLVFAVFFVLRATMPERPEPTPVEPPKKAFRPITRISARIDMPAEKRRALSPGEAAMRHRSYKIESYGADGPHLDIEEFGPTGQFCSATLGEDQLRDVIAAFRPLVGESGWCRTPEEADDSLAFGWRIEDAHPERGNFRLDDGCLEDRPAVVSFIELLGDLAESRRADFVCRDLAR